MNAPFVKLFELCTGYYFYDVGKNCIMAVNEGVYRYIQELCKYGYEEFDEKYKGCQESDYLTVKRLRQKNFLSSKKPEEIYHPYTDFAEEYINNNLNNLILQVTQMCNFNCAYCPYAGNGKFDRSHTNQAMSWEIVQKAVDLLISNSRNVKDLSVGFYGGEPLLEYPLIKKVVKYSKEHARMKNFQFGMTTNGYLIDDEMIDFFKEHNFAITISFDGPQQVHDKNRRLGADGKGTFNQVYQNMKRMKERGLSFGINAVWDTEEDFNQVVNFFDSDPLFSDINITLNQVMTGRIDTGYSISAESKYTEDVFVVKAYLSYLGLNKQLSQKEKDYAIESYESIAKQLKEEEGMPRQFHHDGPCMPGHLKLFVDIYGDFFPCERISGKSKVMKIGSIDTGFDLERIKEILNIGKLTEQECKECWAMQLCSICSMWADNDENAFCKKIKRNRCNYTRNQAGKDIRDYIIITELRNMFQEEKATNGKENNIPVISILKEVTSIKSMKLIQDLCHCFSKIGFQAGVISNCADSGLLDHCEAIPGFMLEPDISGEKKIQLFQKFVSGLLEKQPYDLLIIDVDYGLVQQEGERISLLPDEILKAAEPDFLIVQILANHYQDIGKLRYELEIAAGHKVDALVMSNVYLDMVKYSSKGEKEFLPLSGQSREQLMDQLPEADKEIVFSSKSAERLFDKIIEDLSASIGECQKVCLYE